MITTNREQRLLTAGTTSSSSWCRSTWTLSYPLWYEQCGTHTPRHTWVTLLYLDLVWQKDLLLNFFHLYQLQVLAVLLDHCAWLTQRNSHLYEKQAITYGTDIWWALALGAGSISQEAQIEMNIRFFMQSTVRCKNIIFLWKQNGSTSYFRGLDGEAICGNYRDSCIWQAEHCRWHFNLTEWVDGLLSQFLIGRIFLSAHEVISVWKGSVNTSLL